MTRLFLTIVSLLFWHLSPLAVRIPSVIHSNQLPQATRGRRYEIHLVMRSRAAAKILQGTSIVMYMASCAWSGDDTAVNEALGQASRSTWSGKAEFGSGCSRIRLCGELGKLLVSYLDQAAGSSRISRSPQKQQHSSHPEHRACLSSSALRWALPGFWYSQLSLASLERPLSTGEEAKSKSAQQIE